MNNRHLAPSIRSVQMLSRSASAAVFRSDWRALLPEPEQYYAQCVHRLGHPNVQGWALACCPFHEDNTPSLGVNLCHGGWRCHAGCGRGDMVTFHQRLVGLSFVDAVRDLIGLRGLA